MSYVNTNYEIKRTENQIIRLVIRNVLLKSQIINIVNIHIQILIQKFDKSCMYHKYIGIHIHMHTMRSIHNGNHTHPHSHAHTSTHPQPYRGKNKKRISY